MNNDILAPFNKMFSRLALPGSIASRALSLTGRVGNQATTLDEDIHVSRICGLRSLFVSKLGGEEPSGTLPSV